jgi:hypothetical protein
MPQEMYLLIIDDIDCWYLSMDQSGNLYVSDKVKNEVRKWRRGEKQGTLLAGGQGRGNNLNQLNVPTYIYVDGNETFDVFDEINHRVLKWIKHGKEGIIIAGGHGERNLLMVNMGNDRVQKFLLDPYCSR